MSALHLTIYISDSFYFYSFYSLHFQNGDVSSIRQKKKKHLKDENYLKGITRQKRHEMKKMQQHEKHKTLTPHEMQRTILDKK